MGYNTIGNIPVALCFEVVDMAGKPNPIDLDDLVRRYKEGFTLNDLERNLGISAFKIRKALVSAGVDIRNRKVNRQAVLDAFESGMLAAHIAKTMGINRKSVDIVLASAGLRSSRKIKIDTARMISSYLDGASVKELAGMLGVSRSAIVQRLHEAGIIQRNRSEAMYQRMANTPKEERYRILRNAHASGKGKHRTIREMSLAALTRQARRSTRTSVLESQFAEMLKERGIQFIPQGAVGPYSCDFLVGDIAVEIFGGQWHRYGDHAARAQKRSHYILDAGFHLYAIWCGSLRPLTGAACDDFVAFMEIASRNPTATREYRVIGGAGDFVASGCADDDYIAGVGSFKAA